MILAGATLPDGTNDPNGHWEWRYYYDHADRLYMAEFGIGGADVVSTLNVCLRVTYEYDAEGRLTARKDDRLWTAFHVDANNAAIKPEFIGLGPRSEMTEFAFHGSLDELATHRWARAQVGASLSPKVLQPPPAPL